MNVNSEPNATVYYVTWPWCSHLEQVPARKSRIQALCT